MVKAYKSICDGECRLSDVAACASIEFECRRAGRSARYANIIYPSRVILEATTPRKSRRRVVDVDSSSSLTRAVSHCEFPSTSPASPRTRGFVCVRAHTADRTNSDAAIKDVPALGSPYTRRVSVQRMKPEMFFELKNK